LALTRYVNYQRKRKYVYEPMPFGGEKKKKWMKKGGCRRVRREKE
jgi:hypothetical protein